jgi:nickel superoxide dismutase
MGTLRAIRTPLVLAAAALAGVLAWTAGTSGHCQIPCGIYDDPLRFQLLAEHSATIEKSMQEIRELSKDPGKNANQLIRWVQNKDAHADEFAQTITYYFLQQRIAPAAESDKAAWDAYTRKLALCHKMLVAAMKAKQTTDDQYVRQLRESLADFHKAYFPEGHTPSAATAPAAPHAHGDANRSH